MRAQVQKDAVTAEEIKEEIAEEKAEEKPTLDEEVRIRHVELLVTRFLC